MNSPIYGETLLNPVERKRPLTDAGIEEHFQEIIWNMENGGVNPALAVKQVEATNDLIAKHVDQLPYEIAVGRVGRAYSLAQARAHIAAASLDAPDFTMLRYDAFQAAKRARLMSEQTASTSIPFDMAGTLADIHYMNPVRRTVVLTAIDQRLLGHEIADFESIVRSQDWEAVSKQPLFVERTRELQPDIEPNQAHDAAISAYDAAMESPEGSPERIEYLSAVFTGTAEALQHYQNDSNPDDVTLASCRLLHAMALHDLAKSKKFSGEPSGELTANRVSIELLWQASDQLLQYDTKLDKLLDPPRPLNGYSKDELEELRTGILETNKYRYSQRLRAQVEYLRGQYTEEIGRNPDIHYVLEDEDVIFVRSFGRRAVASIIPQPTEPTHAPLSTESVKTAA